MVGQKHIELIGQINDLREEYATRKLRLSEQTFDNYIGHITCSECDKTLNGGDVYYHVYKEDGFAYGHIISCEDCLTCEEHNDIQFKLLDNEEYCSVSVGNGDDDNQIFKFAPLVGIKLPNDDEHLISIELVKKYCCLPEYSKTKLVDTDNNIDNVASWLPLNEEYNGESPRADDTRNNFIILINVDTACNNEIGCICINENNQYGYYDLDTTLEDLNEMLENWKNSEQGGPTVQTFGRYWMTRKSWEVYFPTEE